MELSVKELVSVVQHQILAKYFSLASAVILIFDTLDNFADEVELIWRQRMSVGKALYIASRYLVYIDVSLMLIYLPQVICCNNIFHARRGSHCRAGPFDTRLCNLEAVDANTCLSLSYGSHALCRKHLESLYPQQYQ